MSKLLIKPFSITTEKYGDIIIMDQEDVPKDLLDDSKYFEKNTNNIDITKYIGKPNKEKYYKLRSFHKKDDHLEPLTKYTFINFPENIEEKIREDYMYLPNIAKKFYHTEIATFASKLTRFLLWSNTNHKCLYIYLETTILKGRFNACNAQTGSELVLHTDSLIDTSYYLKPYENFANTGKQYSIMYMTNLLKSMSSFYMSDLITEKEYNQIKEYDEKLNGEMKNA